MNADIWEEKSRKKAEMGTEVASGCAFSFGSWSQMIWSVKQPPPACAQQRTMQDMIHVVLDALAF